MEKAENKCQEGKLSDAFGVSEQQVKKAFDFVNQVWGNPGESVEISIKALCKGLTPKQKDFALKFMFLGRKIEKNQQQHEIDQFANLMGLLRGSDGR